MPVNSKSLTIRSYKEGDEKGIMKLFREIFGREMTPEEWVWKYKGQGAAKVYSIVTVFQEDTIVGHYGGMPFEMIYQGEKIKGLSLGDVMIHPRHRGLKHFKALTHAVEEILYKEGFLMIYGFPTEKTLMAPAEKLDLYERVEDVFELSRAVCFNNNMSRFIYKLFPMRFDDKRIDELWERVREDFSLAIVRDRKFFRWRYEVHPRYSYEIWGLRKRWSSKLSGLAVLKKEPDRFMVIDLVFQKNTLIPLLDKVENLACTSGTKAVCLWLPQRFHSLLTRSRFELKPFGASIPCSTYPEFLQKDDIKDHFFYTMGDTDFL